MLRFLRSLFRPARPLPTIFVGVDDAFPQCAAVRAMVAQLERARCAPVEIRITRAAHARLSEELNVEYATHVAGVPIRVVDDKDLRA